MGQIASNADGPTSITLAQPSGSAQFRFMGSGGRLHETRALADGVVGGVVIAGNGRDFLAVLTSPHKTTSTTTSQAA